MIFVAPRPVDRPRGALEPRQAPFYSTAKPPPAPPPPEWSKEAERAVHQAHEDLISLFEDNPHVIQPPVHQPNTITSPSGRQIVYVQQRFHSPQASYEQHHAQIIELPHNTQSPQFISSDHGTFGSPYLPQTSCTQIVPYNPTANLELTNFEQETPSPPSRQEQVEANMALTLLKRGKDFS